MLKLEIKRQFFSIGMILAVVLGIILLMVGYHPDIKAYFGLGLEFKYDYVYFVFKCLTSGGFLIFTPLIVVLPGVVQFCDDYNYGFSRLIITRISKKKFLIQRYISTVMVGGLACLLPLLVVSICSVLFNEAPVEYTTFDYTAIYSRFDELWSGKAVIAHICLYGFIFGMVWSSIGLMFAVIIPNKYVALGFPVMIFFLANIILNAFGLYKFSPVNMILIDVQDSQGFVLIYQAVLMSISCIIYILTGNRRLKNA